jgi:5-methylcytosine-specific restriction endonuclease McrA
MDTQCWLVKMYGYPFQRRRNSEWRKTRKPRNGLVGRVEIAARPSRYVVGGQSFVARNVSRNIGDHNTLEFRWTNWRNCAMRPKVVKAEFGRIAMLRAICPRCRSMALVIKGRMACCGAMPEQQDEYIKKKESEGEKRRSKLGAKEKRALLEKQENKCFYCYRPFGTPAWHPGRHKIIYPDIHFDHFVCWDYSRDTSIGNMVAACSICNLIKSSKIFANADDARAFIKHRIGQKGYEFYEDNTKT